MGAEDSITSSHSVPSSQSSALSSIPSGVLTPTLSSNPAKNGDVEDTSIPNAFLSKKKSNKSIIWLPENGCGVTVAGKALWRRNRCSNPRTAQYFAIKKFKGIDQ
ncbi:hypothetical protein FN846DRAFT_904490 [Sphaerosporella brunnea]|uniref:Uncharacterized protein n=1 Tax=Sphaerosporella brunnea TaxID=1250544 RepID=A0A5J5F5E7_9PEZI|nr:hypothetical protein FN846DRAFT_904490 [Sphaerosporella brunnea]